MTCNRCEGHHDARECMIQDLFCEIEERVRVHGSQSIAELQRHLVKNLGAPREAALDAIARWVGDNDA